MDERAPFVSVIIPLWNAPDAVRTCLQALAALAYPQDRYEVIVVDNGSTDESCAVVRQFPSVVLLSEPTPGSYRARNRGLRQAVGDYVAFTDSDCVPDPGWLQAAMRAAAHAPEAGILAGRIELFRSSGGRCDLCATYERLFAFNQEANVASGVCVTANWISPRALLAELGGFAPELRSGGDAECARRIRAIGRPIVYVPDMLVRHPVRTDVGELVRKRRRVVGGRIASERRTRHPLTWLWRYLLISGAQAKRVWRASGLSLPSRIGLTALIVLLGTVSLAEVMRVAVGGEPRRA